MKHLIRLFFVLLFFTPLVLCAQKKNIQVKLISTEDFRLNSYWGVGLVFDYNYGIFYQRQISQKFDIIVGGLYSDVDENEFSGDCADCPSQLTPKTGYYFQTKAGIRYYLKKGKRFHHFVGLGLTSAHQKSLAEYADFAWGQGYYRATHIANSYGVYSEIGSELNIGKRFFIVGMIHGGYYQSHIKRVTYYHKDNTRHTNLFSNDNYPLQLEFRMGYRF